MSAIDPQKYNEIIQEIEEIEFLDISLREKYICLKRILERTCKELTRTETLQFPSLFSRLVFLSQKYDLPKSLEWQLQNIRVKSFFLLKNINNVISQTQYDIAKNSVTNYISIIYTNKKVGEGRDKISSASFSNNIPDRLRVQVVDIDKEKYLLTCHTDCIDGEISVRYNVPKINGAFNATIDRLWNNAQLNLIDSIIDSHTGYIIPRFIVLEPDYLIDASSLAECFQNYGASHLHYFRKKFEPNKNSKHILLGNLANYFLDELVYAENPEEIRFQDVFFNAFKQSPFEFTSCNEIKQKQDFLDFMAKSEKQFENIKRVVIHDFPANNINTRLCTLEPSFFCEKFGFQGRLDLLQIPENLNDIYNIVELKSGGLPYPKHDPGKIATNHEAQTVIYRLIIQSVFGKGSRGISPTILYSAADNTGENIRLSGAYQALEKEIVNIRNLIVATEHYLYIGENDAVDSTFRQMFNLDNYGRVPQFFVDNLTGMEKVLSNITTLEKEYFYRYISFLSRELYLQKMGDESYDSNSGTSALWTTNFLERQESFDLISDLEITEIDDSGNDMKIRFNRIITSNFVNFREGEICILYPHEKEENTLLTNQILKGTIAGISNNEVLVRFRYKQKNKKYLNSHKRWAIEHDKLDHAYNSMYKGLYSFLTSDMNKRNLLLGLKKPKSDYKSVQNISTKEEIQDDIIHKAIAAKDYFLIVGPPGTGKTSIFAQRLIKEFYNNPDNNILVIAYTNRAVDELCETIESIFRHEKASSGHYIRIGSELSCSEPYRPYLLQNISQTVKSRDELRKIIHDKRIFVGTLASIIGKPELFDLKKFNIAIIDEASQILEPQIIGLLPMFDKFIMIGDHKQLSTITLQDNNKSSVGSENLNAIELTDCRESYFERIFRVCTKNKWTEVYDTLVYQGRMHEEIANFPNKYFYDNMLRPACEWQTEPLIRVNGDITNPYHNLIAERRIAFIPCHSADNSVSSDKINRHEANIAVNFAMAIVDVYKTNNLPFDSRKTLGIITPYRNQIALIKHLLQETDIPEIKDIIVDTVERFQGSQRDVIIVSFCINKPYQLDFFSNMNREKTVDRKLNVALTRARQQLFLIGNDYILRQNPIYNELINTIDVTCVNV